MQRDRDEVVLLVARSNINSTIIILSKNTALNELKLIDVVGVKITKVVLYAPYNSAMASCNDYLENLQATDLNCTPKNLANFKITIKKSSFYNLRKMHEDKILFYFCRTFE